jgi:steroid delta-isomerase-like uncharacterized protein
MVPEAREVVAELLQAWNAHDLDWIVSLHAEDYEGTDVGAAAPRRGPEEVRRGWERYLAAFPDLHFTHDEVVAEGDRAAVSWTARGTHLGTLMNIPATRRQVAVRGATFCQVQHGKLRRMLHVWDVAGLLRTIGLLPDL